MALKTIKLNSTEINDRDAELIDSILIDALKERGIEPYNTESAQESFGWEIKILVMTKEEEHDAA
jgi:hypothetical protein